MTLTEDVNHFADKVRQGSEDITTEVHTFPSGAVCLRIRMLGRAFDLDYFPSNGMFWVDELEADAGFNTPYRFGFIHFDSAKEKMLQLLQEAHGQRGNDESRPIQQT